MRKLLYTLVASVMLPLIPAAALADHDDHDRGHGHAYGRDRGWDHDRDWDHYHEWHYHHHIYRDNYYMPYPAEPVYMVPRPVMVEPQPVVVEPPSSLNVIIPIH